MKRLTNTGHIVYTIPGKGERYMPRTEALKRAQKNYVLQKTFSVAFRVNRDLDKDVIAMLEEQENKTDYIKRLIRADILREKGGI